VAERHKERAMKASYELFDHTADVGVRIQAPDMTGLIEPATHGLYAVIGELTASGDTKRLELSFEGSDPAMLLRDYLAEILFAFERDQVCVTSLEVIEFTANRLHIIGRMAPVDRLQSEFQREVKAITYHELTLAPAGGGYQASFVVDI
jgi:SHS2 domain-containing protein